MSPEPRKWVDTVREWAAGVVAERLTELFPTGIPAEVTEAVLAEVDRLLAGEPVHLFELRRLVLSITNETAAKVRAKL